MSDNTVMYTPSILKYTVSFQPNPSVGNYTPDKIVFRNVSHLLITLDSSGQLCQVKERGGMAARKRRIEYRKQKLPNGKDSNASVKHDKEKQEIQKVELPKDNENTKAIVSDLLKSKLKLNCPRNDIVNATRLGPKPKTQKPDRRSILVTTSNRGAKQNIMSACKSVRPSFYVNENLTARRRTILYALRKVKKEHPNVVKGLTTFDGKVCVYIPQSAATTVDSPTSGNRTSAPGANVATTVDPRTSGSGLSTSGAQVGTRDKKILVNTHAGLVRFCNDVVKVPLDTFLAQWPH